MEWFVGRNGESFGPFAFNDLVNGARSGEMRKDDLVWRTGMETWVLANTVAGLWGPLPTSTNFVVPVTTRGNPSSAKENTNRVKRSGRVPITLKRLLVPRGRTNRVSFWGVAFSVYLTGVAAINLVVHWWPVGTQATWGILRCVAVYLLSCIVVGRLHDHDRSGWWASVYVTPVAFFAVLAGREIDLGASAWLVAKGLTLIAVLGIIVHLGLLRGTIGANRFGPDPAVRDHPDDFFSERRAHLLFESPFGTPVLTAIGRTWVALRWLMGKLGGRRLESAMKRVEEKHADGIQRNLELAERKGWHQVARRQGRPVIDPYVRAPTIVSVIAEVIIFMFLVVVITALFVMGVGYGVGIAFHELVGSGWADPPGPIGLIILVVIIALIAVAVGGGLISMRLRKAKARRATNATVSH